MKLLDNTQASRLRIWIIYGSALESLLDRVISHGCGPRDVVFYRVFITLCACVVRGVWCGGGG